MEPITHFLTGACLGRAGFNRKTAYATLAMTLAAEAPDLDVLWGFRGPVAGLQHHRGITHTLLGAPFVALAVTVFVWLYHRFRKPRSPLPPRWRLIWLFALIAVLSHLFLDWTNNYGIRPFFPFNPRWYALDIVFIFEPVIFAALLLGLIMPAVLGLADREIGAAKVVFRGRGWAIAALLVAASVTGARWAEHQRAMQLTANMLFRGQPAIRVGIEPYPVNPFHWFVIAETSRFYETGWADTHHDQVDMNGDVIFKPPVTPAVVAAKNSWLGRVYLDWAKFPVVTDIGKAGLLLSDRPARNAMDTAVEFRDLRFAYSVLNPRIAQNGGPGAAGGSAPLTGLVYVTPEGAIDGMVMNHRTQRRQGKVE